jgi:hypothetical protein
MNLRTLSRVVVPLGLVAAICVALSLLWHVPYIYTLIGLSVWAFFGHLITADDDALGGWSNPDGKAPFPWQALGVKAAVLISLGLIAVAFPSVRALGGQL